MIEIPTICSDLEDTVLSLDVSEVLSDIHIDEYHFLVTLHTVIGGRCILWVRDTRGDTPFEALGRFSSFDKRDVLFFIARYTTSPELRDEIACRRFERRVDTLTLRFFDAVEKHSRTDRVAAYKNLFDLDDQIDQRALARRRRLMARRFHPDAGGDHRAMSLINEAYDFLTQDDAHDADAAR